MATPYKRVKIVKATNGFKVGDTVDVDADTAEKLIASQSARLLGAGNPPDTDKKPAPKPGE